MPFAAYLRAIKTYTLSVILTTAAAVTAAAIGIIKRHTVVAGKSFGTLDYLIIAQLVISIFVTKAKSTTAPYLTAAHSKPGTFSSIAIMAQLAYALQHLSFSVRQV